MKTATVYRNEKAARYPNAATRKEVLHKYLDTLLTFACCGGILATLYFLLTVF
jgi:hypothetical protein